MKRLFLFCVFNATILFVSAGETVAPHNDKLPTKNKDDKPETTGRLRHGDDTDASDPAGNVAVYVRFPTKLCSGMMANSEWVITAAHCVVGLQTGDTVSLFYTNSTGAKSRTDATVVEEIFMHPRYNPNSLAPIFYGRKAALDFGMFRLAESTTTCQDGFRCSITDPDHPMNAVFAYSESAIFRRKELISIGYGATTERGFGHSGTLRKGFIRAFSRTSLFGGSFWLQIWRNRIFGSNPARTCSGDSGSPLLMQTEDSPLTGFSVVGILSGGISCDSWIGFKCFYRLMKETADVIRARVVSSGGNCKTFVASNGSNLMHCTG